MEPAAQGMRCALCGAGADVHCAADAAFLCGACDADVHGANFLASRHRRTSVSTPKGRDDKDDHADDVSASASSSCLSTADSAPTTPMAPRRRMPMRRPTRGESMLHGWAKRTAIVASGAKRRRPTAAACALQQDVAAAQPRMPLRVGMAAAAHGSGVHENADAIRRLEARARVPGRLVVAVASSMEGARGKRVAVAMDTKEGWGECS